MNASGYLDDMKDYSVLFLTARNKSDKRWNRLRFIAATKSILSKQGNLMSHSFGQPSTMQNFLFWMD